MYGGCGETNSRGNGVLEYWSIGKKTGALDAADIAFPITPLLHHSITPVVSLSDDVGG
jgi:hypothetical protein